MFCYVVVIMITTFTVNTRFVLFCKMCFHLHCLILMFVNVATVTGGPVFTRVLSSPHRNVSDLWNAAAHALLFLKRLQEKEKRQVKTTFIALFKRS